VAGADELACVPLLDRVVHLVDDAVVLVVEARVDVVRPAALEVDEAAAAADHGRESGAVALVAEERLGVVGPAEGAVDVDLRAGVLRDDICASALGHTSSLTGGQA
jgi:hypothetical protein